MRAETIGVRQVNDTSRLHRFHVRRSVVPGTGEHSLRGGAPVSNKSPAVGMLNDTSARDCARVRCCRGGCDRPQAQTAIDTANAGMAIDANTAQRGRPDIGSAARSRAIARQRRPILRETRAIGHAPSLMNSCHGIPVMTSSFIAVGLDAPLTPRRMREIWDREGLPFKSLASSASVEPRFSIHDCSRFIGGNVH